MLTQHVLGRRSEIYVKPSSGVFTRPSFPKKMCYNRLRTESAMSTWLLLFRKKNQEIPSPLEPSYVSVCGALQPFHIRIRAVALGIEFLLIYAITHATTGQSPWRGPAAPYCPYVPIRASVYCMACTAWLTHHCQVRPPPATSYIRYTTKASTSGQRRRLTRVGNSTLQRANLAPRSAQESGEVRAWWRSVE
jgi:hypothetical protein